MTLHGYSRSKKSKENMWRPDRHLTHNIWDTGTELE